MEFNRAIQPDSLLQGEALTAVIAGIGMNFASASNLDPNIEDTILAASVEGLVHKDCRVLSMLVAWLEIHGAWINADRLTDQNLTSKSY